MFKDSQLLELLTLKTFFKNKLLELVPKGSTSIEIGVWKGGFSSLILNRIKPKKLYLIDPWKYKPQFKNRWYGGTLAKSQSDMDKLYKSVKKKFKNQNNVEMIRKPSHEAAGDFKDRSVDFVYIDGDHSFDAVYQDLVSYYPKLKKDGILAGDDYFWGITQDLPVRKAVRKYAKEKSLSIKMLGTQFMIRKK